MHQFYIKCRRYILLLDVYRSLKISYITITIYKDGRYRYQSLHMLFSRESYIPGRQGKNRIYNRYIEILDYSLEI